MKQVSIREHKFWVSYAAWAPAIMSAFGWAAGEGTIAAAGPILMAAAITAIAYGAAR